MHYTLVPIGSAGDVFPYLTLALRLRDRGHSISFITNDHFRPLIESHHIPFSAYGSAQQYREAIANPDIFHPRKGFKTVIGMVADQRQLMDLIRKNTPPEGIVIAHTLAFAARLLDEAGERRAVSLILQPAVLRSVHAPAVMFGKNGLNGLPRWAVRGTWWLADRLIVDPLLAPILDPLRKELGLPRIRRFFATWVNSPRLSIAMFPEWYAPRPADWPASLQYAGFPLGDDFSDQPVDGKLMEFVERNRPVVFTFGSGFIHGHEHFAAAVEACRRLGRPGLLLTTHREQVPTDLPPGVMHHDFAPLSRILPHCQSIVHHGGIGTTAAAIAAGLPQVITPMSHDQPDNAARIVRLGLGRRIMPPRFTARSLAQAMDELLRDSPIAHQCQIRKEQLARQDYEVPCLLLEAASKGR